MNEEIGMEEIKRFEFVISKHDRINGRHIFNLHIEGTGIAKEEFEKMLKQILGEIPELNREI